MVVGASVCFSAVAAAVLWIYICVCVSGYEMKVSGLEVPLAFYIFERANSDRRKFPKKDIFDVAPMSSRKGISRSFCHLSFIHLG